MSFTLPLDINLSAKKDSRHFTRSWCTVCEISKLNSIHALYTRSLGIVANNLCSGRIILYNDAAYNTFQHQQVT